jgi:nitrous oxidase accessory protein NosD
MTAVTHASTTLLVLTVLLGGSSGEAARSELPNDLQRLISEAKPGAIVTLPPGVHRGAVKIDKPLTFKGESPEECVLELTADEPAVLVSSKAPVIIDSITIKWQLATSERLEGPACALAVRDGNATIRNCRVIALGNFKRCPSAVQCLGFSNVKLENCRFEGFEFTIGYAGGAEGSITDCVILNPGHCGATVYSGSKIDVARNIVTGSGYHGLRCTGGALFAHDNLIIKNKNRGIYLGNKSASGKVSNNVIMSNGTGISAFAQTDVAIENNLILNSSYAGLGTRDSCPLKVRNNIFQENTRGIVVFAEAGRNQVTLEQNSFWKNETDTENVDRPRNSVIVDPRFEAPERGDFSSQADELKTNKQGLSNPSVFRDLWQKWNAVLQEM